MVPFVSEIGIFCRSDGDLAHADYLVLLNLLDVWLGVDKSDYGDLEKNWEVRGVAVKGRWNNWSISGYVREWWQTRITPRIDRAGAMMQASGVVRGEAIWSKPRAYTSVHMFLPSLCQKCGRWGKEPNLGCPAIGVTQEGTAWIRPDNSGSKSLVDLYSWIALIASPIPRRWQRNGFNRIEEQLLYYVYLCRWEVTSETNAHTF